MKFYLRKHMQLYNYQNEGVRFLVAQGNALLADEVGLGKSVQAITACEQLQARKVLILCPAILKEQWKAEIYKIMPEATTQVISGKQSERINQWKVQWLDFGFVKYTIANYELLLRDFKAIQNIKWDVIIADEATHISNPRAKQSKAIKQLYSRYRIALTGTPYNNKVDDIWNMIDWLRPGILGNWWQFTNNFVVRNKWNAVIGYRNLDLLKAKIDPYILRRTKQEVLRELPEIITSDIPFVLGEEERKLYDQIRKELLFEIQEADINKIENPVTIQQSLTKMLRLRQLVNSMELLGENKVSTKLEVLKELLPTVLNGEKKAIIFSEFSKMCDILERELHEYKPLKITGEVSGRDEILEKFNNDEESRILVMSSAGQFGLNIQRASVVVHYDNAWSLSKMIQRLGRAHRIGQKDVVLEYHLLGKGTADMYVKKTLDKKKEMADFMLGAQEIREILSYED